MADEEEEFESENEFINIASKTEFPKALTKDEAADCLTCVGPTFRKIDKAFSYSSCSYAYIGMDVVGRGLTNVDILPYFTHVLFLDLSKNRLTNESLLILGEMEQLITLIVDKNLLDSALLPIFPQLQILSLKNNLITSSEMNLQPNLEYLELAGNKIEEVHPLLWGPKWVPKLKELGLRNNGFKTPAGINFPNLVSLFLADNDIDLLEGLEVLTNLKFLHLRNNPLKKLDGFSEANRKLFYINVRGCNIKTVKEFKKLSVLPKLERIVVSENPCAKNNYRIQLVAFLPKLRRINKTLVEKNERRKARRLTKKMGEYDNDNVDDEEALEEDDDNY